MVPSDPDVLFHQEDPPALHEKRTEKSAVRAN